ncbi:MAG: beta-ketoacyl-ACP synthase, partial [Cyanothece sp. SIO1E1]|nr:beta-ketoacyl-ACP synthase [Cyanothece sp. SIO1E1]
MVSALGTSAEENWQNLMAGQSAIAIHQPFADLGPRPLGLIGPNLIDVKALTQQVVRAAMVDAGIVSPLPDCGVVIGSSRAQQATWEQLAGAYQRESGQLPGNWLETLPHMAAIATAAQIGSKGPVLAPMAACATGLWAIAQGFEWVQTGQCQRVIAGAVEAPITPLTLAGFDKM